uniref:Uncharacterized protein n=1 Tax=Parascaris equorum TaxID=6256 RepID=A0A914RQM9_PAREQ
MHTLGDFLFVVFVIGFTSSYIKEIRRSSNRNLTRQGDLFYCLNFHSALICNFGSDLIDA